MEDDIRQVEGIPRLSINRARTWQWGHGVTEENLEGWINATVSMSTRILG